MPPMLPLGKKAFRALIVGLPMIGACHGDAPRPALPAVAPADAGSGGQGSADAAARPKRGPVVVALVVDQLAAWIAEERFPVLPESGGFARLRREGTWAMDLRYAHAVTDTAPGHAALFTGAVPRKTGIWANERVDVDLRARISILRDPATKLVTARGVADAWGSSLAALRVDTVADALKAARPDAYVAALSIKDRGALFGAGRKPDVAVWYDNTAGFVTSTAFATKLPEWAAKETRAIASAPAWTLLDEGFVRAHAKTPDDQPGEGDVAGLGVTFPHPAPSASKRPGLAFRYGPWGDAALLRMARAALDDALAPGAKAERPILLAVSLSTHDQVAHVFGPDSWEEWDELLRLDAELGRFFADLDARLGPDGWSAVLSADHGTTTMPEAAAIARPWCDGDAGVDRLERACGKVGRILQDELAVELRAVAERSAGRGDWVLGVADPYVYFTPDERALAPAKRAALERAVVRAIEAKPEVAKVFTVTADCEERGEDVAAAVCRSTLPEIAGALYVVLKPGSFFDPLHANGKGTSHGSPYPFDRSVPLLVRAPGRAAAGAVVREVAPFASYARTVSGLLGVGAPAAADVGRDFGVQIR